MSELRQPIAQERQAPMTQKRQLTPAQMQWQAQVFRQKGWKSKTAEQAVLKTAIQPVIDKALASLMQPQGPNSAAYLIAEKLDPGKEFKAYLTALAAYEKLPHPRNQDPQYLKLGSILRKAAQDYIAHFDTHSDRQKQQRDTRRKYDACQKTLADLLKEQHFLKMSNPPWDSATAMAAAAMKAEADFASLPLDKQSAEQLSGKGVNPTFWVNKKGTNPDKAAKSFLFKPQTTKQERPSIPVGGEPAREAMTGRAADVLNGMTGIDFKVPETHIVEVGRERFPVGTLSAQVADRDGTGPLVGSLQQFAPTDGEIREQPPSKARAVKPERCQELAILDIVTGHVDRHGGNFLMTGDLKSADLVPIDNGLSFPETPDDLDKMSTKHNALLAIPGAHEPFSPEMIKKIDKIDPDVLRTALKGERSAIEGGHPSAKGMVGDKALDQSRRSAMFLKLACRTLNPAAVQVAIGQNGSSLFPDPAISDEEFEKRAKKIITDMAADQAVLAEYFLMSPEEAKTRDDAIVAKNWPESVIKNPKIAMILFKQDTPAPPRVDQLMDGKREDAKEADLKEMTAVFPKATFKDIPRWLALKANVKSPDREAIRRKFDEANDYLKTSPDFGLRSALDILRKYDTVMTAVDNEDAQGGANKLLLMKLTKIAEMAKILPDRTQGQQLRDLAASLATSNKAKQLDTLRDGLIGKLQALLKTEIDTVCDDAKKRLSAEQWAQVEKELKIESSSPAVASTGGFVLEAKAMIDAARQKWNL